MDVARIVVPMLVAAAALGGCARFHFYSSPDLEGKETGLRIYTPKPYLLVSHTGAKDKPVEVSIQYLPDLAHPIYVKASSGWGSSNLTMSFADGKLTSFGQQTDTKIPDTITSLATLATALGFKKTEIAAPPGKELQFELYEIEMTPTGTALKRVQFP